MIDNRIYTFLKLCEVMNYRKTADILNMTQPAVTQHIHYLESQYNVKLFVYKSKTLSKTPECIALEQYARSTVYNEHIFKNEINNNNIFKLSIGATKTVGDYVIKDIISDFITNKNIELEVVVDNTSKLLRQLKNLELDFLIVEGYFDKSKYDYKLLRQAELVGICSLNHKFANKTIPLEDIFDEHIILREEGSGTRQVLENFLQDYNYSNNCFSRKTIISSFKLMESIVEENMCISFVYDDIPKDNKNLATFKIKDNKIFHEFNYVFLKGSKATAFIK